MPVTASQPHRQPADQLGAIGRRVREGVEGPGLRRDANLLAAALICQRQVASADLDVDKVMDAVLEEVRALTGAERAGIATVGETGDLRIAAAVGMAPGTVGRLLVPETSPIRRVFDTGLAILSDDLSQIRDTAASPNQSTSGAGVVLEHHRQRLGVLFCASPRPAAFTSYDVQALELLAGIVGPALAQAREVERRRSVEAELRESRERLTTIVETMAEGIVIFDAAGLVSFANPAAERLLKRARGSLVGLDARRAGVRLHRLDGRPMRGDESPLARAGASVEPIVGEDVRFLRHDRTFLDATINAVAIRDAEGAVTSLVLTINDATQRRRAELTRRESEERLRAIVASTFDGIVAADGDGRILEFNSAAESLFGRSRSEVIGQPARILAPASLRRRHDAGVQRRRSAPEREFSRRLETTAVRADGTEFPIELSLRGLIERGRPMYVASIRDVTARAEAESARRESDAKSRFLAAMSHELRTPLNSILGFAQLLSQDGFGALNERQLRYVGHIEGSGRHLLSLINDVLDLSKVAAGEMRISLEPVAVDAALRDAVTQVTPLAEAGSLELAVSGAPGLTVLADRQRLHQVLGNLLSNAVKFTPAGRVWIDVEPGASEVAIRVGDSGIGIPAERLEDIFLEFTQVESELTRSHEGTGLGLALTRRLVELMGGRIEVVSEVGKGSVFSLWLPAALSVNPSENQDKT